MRKADLSIIISNYNKKHEWLMECMDSIKAQTVPPREVILVDDCSDDPKAHALATSIILPENKGVANARDVGFRQSRGKLILFLDADDKLSPDFIEKCGEKIDKSDIVYTDFILTGRVERPKLERTPDEITPQNLLNKDCPLRVTSMMHRKVYEDVGGFRKLPVFEDWDFWLRAMSNDCTFAKANTYFEYRQTGKGRIAVSGYTKEEVHHQIIKDYQIKQGKLCLKDSKPKQA
jgi:glycosyltransferase involved in cell wall biosynthesis